MIRQLIYNGFMDGSSSAAEFPLLIDGIAFFPHFSYRYLYTLVKVKRAEMKTALCIGFPVECLRWLLFLEPRIADLQYAAFRSGKIIIKRLTGVFPVRSIDLSIDRPDSGCVGDIPIC